MRPEQLDVEAIAEVQGSRSGSCTRTRRTVLFAADGGGEGFELATAS